jgi:uncharacterized protein (TIGR02271 family)
LAHEKRGGRPTEDDFAGYTVYDMHYEKIGKVDDVFVGEGDDPEYIGVRVGLLGNKTTLIPIEIVRVNDKRQLVEIAADKDAVEKGPTFSDDHEITPEFERRVFGHYGVKEVQGSEQRGARGGPYDSEATGDERVDLQPRERTEVREESSGERRFGEERSHSATRDDVGRERGSDPADENELRVQRVEEELRAGTREREVGATRVRKRVRTERERLTVPKKREEVHVEKVPVEGRRGDTPEGEIGEGEIRIPIVEEEVVVEKRPVVKEEIRLRKEVFEDEEVVEEDVRKEEVEVDDQTTGRGDR